MASAEKALIAQENEIQALKRRAKNAYMNNKKQISEALEAGVAMATAGAFGYIDARYTERRDVAGLPASGVVGAGVLGAQLAGLLPAEPYITGLASGALAAAGYRKGFEKGQTDKAAAGA